MFCGLYSNIEVYSKQHILALHPDPNHDIRVPKTKRNSGNSFLSTSYIIAQLQILDVEFWGLCNLGLSVSAQFPKVATWFQSYAHFSMSAIFYNAEDVKKKLFISFSIN